jgi:two-component system, NtrC family, response regulator GlrR
MEPLILIFNPTGSKLEKDLTELLDQNHGMNYVCIHDLESENTFSGIQPSVIFIILETADISEQSLKIQNLSLRFSTVPVIGILNNSDIDSDLLRKSFWSFLTLPLKKEDIFLTIKLFCQHTHGENKSVYSSLKRNMSDLFKGESAVSLEIKQKILKISNYDVTVLINGETGTGKELSAKMIHYLSDRSNYPFVPVNCGAMPSELFENELFGHKKGAYTNADSSETGLIAEADNGTLFLDEIESLPEAMQVKLLRFLEEKQYKPLGQAAYVSSNARIIAAAKENLWERVKNNQFRQDLFYRLNVLSITLPPLRDRWEDIPVLASYFVNRYSKLYNKSIDGIRPIVMMRMLHYTWEGNIRELQNLLQEAVIMNTTGWIEEDDLNFNKNGHDETRAIVSFKSAKQMTVRNFEKTYLNNLLIAFKGNLTQAAKFAKKDRRAFIRLIKKYELNPASYR